MQVLSMIIGSAIVFNGLLAGISIDASLVKLPARRRIGNIAYAAFARGNDLGNGIIVYSSLAVLAALLVFIATLTAFLQDKKSSLLLLLIGASFTTIIHFLGTAKAAPIMLSIKNTPDEEAVLKKKFDQFEKWNGIRACFQLITFILLISCFILNR
ncbi:MAG TPA: hypothetical protein VGG71_14810 [Chitinophagaceae bacterium]|jgi:hypothetical protein